MSKQWHMIAGRGKLGDMNWGAEFDGDASKLQPQLDELLKHIGEVVLITGGGSFTGSFWLGVLKSAEIVDAFDHKKALKARLENMTPQMHYDNDVFEPFVNSWQISVLQ